MRSVKAGQVWIYKQFYEGKPAIFRVIEVTDHIVKYTFKGTYFGSLGSLDHGVKAISIEIFNKWIESRDFTLKGNSAEIWKELNEQ